MREPLETIGMPLHYSMVLRIGIDEHHCWQWTLVSDCQKRLKERKRNPGKWERHQVHWDDCAESKLFDDRRHTHRHLAEQAGEVCHRASRCRRSVANEPDSWKQCKKNPTRAGSA